MIEDILSKTNFQAYHPKRDKNISIFKLKQASQASSISNTTECKPNDENKDTSAKSYFVEDDFWNDGIRFKSSLGSTPIQTKPKNTNERADTFISCK